jgi:hypothetical protein
MLKIAEHDPAPAFRVAVQLPPILALIVVCPVGNAPPESTWRASTIATPMSAYRQAAIGLGRKRLSAAQTKRATSIDWWPEMHLQNGLKG